MAAEIDDLTHALGETADVDRLKHDAASARLAGVAPTPASSDAPIVAVSTATQPPTATACSTASP